MNMFARFDENPSMTLQDINETKRYGRTTRKTVYPQQNKVCGAGGGGIQVRLSLIFLLILVRLAWGLKQIPRKNNNNMPIVCDFLTNIW